MAEEYVIIYNRVGKPLAEIEPSSISRSWTLSNVGRGEMELPLTDPKLDDDIIRYGNLVAVFSDVVPLWAGVILPPTRINQTSVQFSMYSGEALLKLRPVELATSEKGSPGALFRKIIHQVRNLYQWNLLDGDIQESAQKMALTEPYRDALDLAIMLVEKSNQEFIVEPRIENQRLMFYAHWKYRVGAWHGKTVRLMEGHNMSADFTLEESGDLINEVLVVGKGDDNESRPTTRVILPDFAGAFGRWCRVVESSDVEEMDELKNLGEHELEKCGLPTFRLLIETLNVDGLWKIMNVGDTVGIELVSYIYSPSFVVPAKNVARILGTSFDAAEGVMPVVVEASYDKTFQQGVGR